MRGAIIPISQVAQAVGVSQKTMKRRLKKIEARIGGGLLVRPSAATGGWLYVNLDALERLAILPGGRRWPAGRRDDDQMSPADQNSADRDEDMGCASAVIMAKLSDIELAFLSLRDAITERSI